MASVSAGAGLRQTAQPTPTGPPGLATHRRAWSIGLTWAGRRLQVRSATYRLAFSLSDGQFEKKPPEAKVSFSKNLSYEDPDLNWRGVACEKKKNSYLPNEGSHWANQTDKDQTWPGLERDLGGAAIAAGEIVPDPAIPRYMECCGGRSGVLARDENLAEFWSRHEWWTEWLWP